MATSELVLYKGCKIAKDKNFVVEDIDSYLETLQAITIQNFQYLKHALKLTVKVDMSQDELSCDKLFDDTYNYARIKANNEDAYYYYFVDSKKWIAEHTVALELTQDTLNTYKLGVNYGLGEKTKITRQHKDRLVRSDAVIKHGLGYTSVSENDWQKVNGN